MEKYKGRNRQRNNRGMSLVEVVIAMAIFAIATVPIMNILVSTARYNARARERQHMTLSAESIMESFKAYDIETLCEQFQSPSFRGCTLYPGGVDPAGVAIPAGTMEVFGKNAAGLETTVLFDPSGTFIGSSDDTYRFRINSMQNETERYDAEILVEPYAVAGTNQITKLTDMNPYRDAIFRSSADYDGNISAQIHTHFQNNVVPDIVAKLNAEDLIKNDYTEADISFSSANIVITQRETFIDIVKGSNITAQCKMRYHYKVEQYPYHNNPSDDTSYDYLDFPLDGTDYVVDLLMYSPDGWHVEFYNNPPEAGLERVFIYYYPNYEVTKDTINISTSGFGSDKLDCYLLKQKRPGMSNSSIMTEEASYVPEINGTGNLNLYHNFGENISGSSSVPTVSPSGFAASRSYVDTTVVKEDRTLMYKVTVNLYEAGGTEVIASFDGTMND